MSKYYKVEDVEMLMVFSGICDGRTCGEIAKALQSLPTIEVSEDAISREVAMDIVVSSTAEEMVEKIRNAPPIIPQPKRASG